MEKQLNDVKKAYQREIQTNAARSSFIKDTEEKYEQVYLKYFKKFNFVSS